MLPFFWSGPNGPQGFPQTQAKLAAEVNSCRLANGGRDGYEIPNNRLRTLVAHWERLYKPSGMSRHAFWALAGWMYYSDQPNEFNLIAARYEAYLQQYAMANTPSPEQLLDYGFAFCLGVGLNLGDRAFVREAAHHAAYWALQSWLMRKEIWIREKMVPMRLHLDDLELLELNSVIDTLLGSHNSLVVDSFLERRKKAKRADVEKRHRLHHHLISWLDSTGWPATKNYYAIETFLFRGVVGDRPQHPKGFEKGILFPSLKSVGSDLDQGLVLICRSCQSLWGSFDYCPICLAELPEFDEASRIVALNGDVRKVQVLRCQAPGCDQYTESESAMCARHFGEQPEAKKRRMPLTVFQHLTYQQQA